MEFNIGILMPITQTDITDTMTTANISNIWSIVSKNSENIIISNHIMICDF